MNGITHKLAERLATLEEAVGIRKRLRRAAFLYEDSDGTLRDAHTGELVDLDARRQAGMTYRVMMDAGSMDPEPLPSEEGGDGRKET